MNLLRKFKKKSSIVIGFLILFILFVIIICFVIPTRAGIQLTDYPKWLTDQLNNENVQSWLQQRGVLEASTAEFFIQEGYLKFNFKVTNNDKLKAIEFNRRLGVGGDYLEGISFKLDPDSLNKLQPIMPIHVNLNIDDDKVTFSSKGSNLLSPGFSGQNYNIATGSGKLSFQAKDSQSFDLQIQDPEPVLQYATGSGQLHLSSKLNPMFPILQKVATIKVSVDGKNVNGEVTLK
jgi:hypothetical protein